MALTGKEMETLKRLQAKAAEPVSPLSEDDLRTMEEHVADVYDCAPAILTGLMEPWQVVINRLKALAEDNARLITEVRRLTANANLPGGREAD